MSALEVMHERRSRFVEDLAKRQRKDVEIIIRESALPYLPAKALLKFRSICRDWNLTISNPFFNHNQSHSHRKMSGLFNQPPSGKPSFISLDEAAYGVPDPSLSFLPVPVDIRSSTNGLLLCQGCINKLYYVCNPVNKEWTVLPKPSSQHGTDPAAVLVFEPSVLNFSADYKVICPFASIDFPGSTEFEIYSSGKKAWEVSREICFNKRVQSGSGIYINKTIYWTTAHGILAFDSINEHASAHSNYFILRATLVEMYGKLCYANLKCSKFTVSLVDLYQNTMPMNDKSHQSSSKFILDVDKTFTGNITNAQVLPSIGGDVFVFLAGERMASYHVFTGEFKVLSTTMRLSGKWFPYVNSLVSVSSN
ncbi:F-box protein [Thalictrum thalictroides]|uniref:F-box protein n=1 Tax=Thalictrum thalictroides TaxID=46969 RepID=A0A7J6WE85_THATH|nr:F-box protein [Thalictrum thalictroides]